MTQTVDRLNSSLNLCYLVQSIMLDLLRSLNDDDENFDSLFCSTAQKPTIVFTFFRCDCHDHALNTLLKPIHIYIYITSENRHRLRQSIKLSMPSRETHAKTVNSSRFNDMHKITTESMIKTNDEERQNSMKTFFFIIVWNSTYNTHIVCVSEYCRSVCVIV